MKIIFNRKITRELFKCRVVQVELNYPFIIRLRFYFEGSLDEAKAFVKVHCGGSNSAENSGTI